MCDGRGRRGGFTIQVCSGHLEQFVTIPSYQGIKFEPALISKKNQQHRNKHKRREKVREGSTWHSKHGLFSHPATRSILIHRYSRIIWPDREQINSESFENGVENKRFKKKKGSKE